MSYVAERTHVMLLTDLKRGIDDLVGSRNRSHFLNEAGRKELARMRLLKSAHKAAGILAKGGIPEWRTPESTSAWVRSIRREADEHMRRAHGR